MDKLTVNLDDSGSKQGHDKGIKAGSDNVGLLFKIINNYWIRLAVAGPRFLLASVSADNTNQGFDSSVIIGKPNLQLQVLSGLGLESFLLCYPF